jgi:hypothetical protein
LFGNFLRSCTTGSFSRRAQLHEVNQWWEGTVQKAGRCRELFTGAEHEKIETK